MNILGISAFYHDSAAALIVDGKITAAAQEERFTRKKHDPAFPAEAINYCLTEGGLAADQIDYVAFYEKPLLKFDRLLETYLSYAPAGLKSFRMAMPIWLKQKLFMRRELTRGLGKDFKGKLVFTEHHESHAASAFFPSPFEKAAILTIDGVGEWATTTYGEGNGHKLTLQEEIGFPHSLGLLYSAFTYYCGFRVNSGEYKLMGLAPYGEPKYVDQIDGTLVDICEDGSFRLDMQYFNYCQGLTMTNAKFEALMGAPRREAEADLTQFYMDVAASIQVVTENIILKLGKHVHESTGQENLCLAGGVALNCVANGKLLREGPFKNVWIQPAAGDAGGALGGAQFVWHQLLENPRSVHSDQGPSYFGPNYSQEEISSLLDSKGAVYHVATSDEDLAEQVAQLIADQKVVGWFQGRMEFGPRALGARSILGDARSEEMQRIMNLKIKFRESFRPFAPVVLKERAHEYFSVRENEDSPYMLMVAPVRDEKRLDAGQSSHELEGLEKLQASRSVVPAVTHVDYSARVQTVDKERHALLYQLLTAFERRTGSPVIINTSFNVRGEPIVCQPADAYHCFMGTNMDVLVLERAIVLKSEQPNAGEVTNEDYLAQFALD